MIVHGSRGSMFVRKVHVVLREKGIAFEERALVPVPKTSDLLEKNPLGKIPILEADDGGFIPDSSVICLYLERTSPEPAVYPSDPAQYARALFIEEYADTRVFEVAGGVLFERFVKPQLLGQPTDEARVHTLLTQELPPVLDWLQSQVHPERPTLLPQFSVADAAVAAQLAALPAVGEAVDAKRWPRLARYLDGMWARPSFVESAPQ